MHKLHFSEPRDAFLSNANSKKENHGEELVNRVDLNLTLAVDRDKLNELFIEPAAIQKGLWDEDGMVLDGEMSLDLNSVAEQQLIDVAGMKFGGSKVKLQAAKPAPGWTVDLDIQVQVYPGGTKEGKLAIGTLCDKQRQDVKISITNQQESIDD